MNSGIIFQQTKPILEVDVNPIKIKHEEVVPMRKKEQSWA